MQLTEKILRIKNMRLPFVVSVYLLFFISGAAALMYQVVWTRSLSLIFGGSHLAVTVVLSTFMAGLALGSYVIGKSADSIRKPLRFYGILEIGIALFAVVFVWLASAYPSLYVALARGKNDSYLYLTVIRVAFSVIALIVPTTLMGGTLPILSRFLSRQPDKVRGYLAFLYGFNTLGAVTGAAAAGFFFLRFYSVSLTLKTAIAMNLIIGLTSIVMQEKGARFFAREEELPSSSQPETPSKPEAAEKVPASLFSLKLVIIGIGVSGFCALGYEVLWTRILSIVVGASVYSFTTMLVAFLTGIALGSGAFGFLPRVFRVRDKGIARSILWFGVIQIVIGIAALVVTVSIRNLPQTSVRLRNYFMSQGLAQFDVQLWSNFIVAYAYMVVPAFFMGVAFPLAGKIHAQFKRMVGSAVGEVMAYNTVGAILGAAISGFLLIYVFGIERSLQLLVVLNIGFGFLVIASLRQRNWLNVAVAGATAALAIVLLASPDSFRIWNRKYFAIFRNNQPEAFRTPEMLREALENTDVLYYDQGVEATISSIRIKGGGDQALLVNGKVVASTHMEGQQCQLTLGHLPMLLHKNPKKVLVVGLGTGMTLGATSVHPSVEDVTLVEIEPKVVGGARTFEDYNHQVLDNPKLRTVFNDGRNFLLTTPEKYDVITADPIHPWAQGASYLYTVEYFKLASERLRPGGIMCQWLPVYELSLEDLKSVVRTFGRSFEYTMLWLTHHDAELIGSNSPIIIGEEELERRIAVEDVSSDLNRVKMGSATDFLSYFVAGTEELEAFGANGVLNTDDNLYLEFSSPLSIAEPVMTENLIHLAKYQESILPYLKRPEDKTLRAKQEQKWQNHLEAARVAIEAQALFVGNLYETPEFKGLMDILDSNYAWFAPGRFLKREYIAALEQIPRLIEASEFAFIDKTGARRVVEISAVLAPISSERGYVVFVDNDARVIYGKFLVTDLTSDYPRAVAAVMKKLQEAYLEEARNAIRQGRSLPSDFFLGKIKGIIAEEQS